MSASPTARRRRWRAVSRPEAPRRGGSVAGQLLHPVDPGDLLDEVGLAGDVGAAEERDGHVEAVGGVDGLELERLEDLAAAGARDRGAEQRRRCARRAGGWWPAAGPRHRRRSCPGRRVAPHSSIISWVATRLGLQRQLGRSPFSKRPEASLRRPSLSEVRWMLAPSQVAASISTRVVPGVHLGARAAHHAGDRGRVRRASAMSTMSESSVRVWPSRVCTCSPVVRRGAR